MEGIEIEVESPAFWESAEPRLMWNPALGDAFGEIEAFLPGCEGLAGHLVFRTSGTEGGAKYVCVSRRAILASAGAVNRHLAAGPGDRWMRALPLFHVGGIGVHARAHLAGCEIFVQEGKWDGPAFVRSCREKQATLSALVPAQVYDLVCEELEAPPSLRAVIVGGGGLDAAAGNRAWELGWPLLPSYGLSEGASQVATADLASLGRDRFENGRLPVLDPWEVRESDAGLLEIRGEALFSGYLREDGDVVAFEDPRMDGWFTTRDRVLIERGDGGGFSLLFAGRVTP